MPDQGATYSEFIRHQEDVERGRRAALDARGAGIITTNGVFATLATGALTLLAGSSGPQLTVGAKVTLLLALALLIASGFVGLSATQLRWYTVTSPDTLRAMLAAPRWRDDEVDARNATSLSTLRTVESLRAGNDRKASRVVAAVYLQMFGVAGLACTAAVQAMWGHAA